MTRRMLEVCFYHAYGRPCEYHSKGKRSYSHDSQPMPFGYYKQPDQPERKRKAKAPRDRLMGMRLEDFCSVVDILP